MVELTEGKKVTTWKQLIHKVVLRHWELLKRVVSEEESCLVKGKGMNMYYITWRI